MSKPKAQAQPPAGKIARAASAAENELISGDLRRRVEARLAAWKQADFAARLWRKDPTLWSAEPLPEIKDRLDWLDLPVAMQARATALTAFAAEVRRDEIRHVVWMGMGGSSLAPAVFDKLLGVAAGYPELIVLDSTHPATVEAVAARVDVAQSLFVVASKSGTTLEPLSHFNFFWDRVARATPHPGRHFAAVTDPGTPLEHLGRERQFRDVFLAMPNLGGRFSALSDFGLLAAALIGADIEALLRRAAAMAADCGAEVPSAANPGLRLGAILGEAALAGRDKLTFLASARLAPFADWLEQLVAESTGKSDKGILPVAREPLGPPEVYGADRLFVAFTLEGDRTSESEEATAALAAAGHPLLRLHFDQAIDIAPEMFRWEVAVAAACAVIGVHPFNQPDVELAKKLAHEIMDGSARNQDKGPTSTSPSGEGAEPRERLASWLAEAQPGGYVAIQAFLAESEETTAALQHLRLALRDRLKLATTLGYGPRFLHSTGQLHKGGLEGGLFLQLVDDPGDALPIPEAGYSFGKLVQAQALGDFRALRQRGRKVVRIKLANPVAADVKRLASELQEALRRAGR
jgi:transaldolase / glucose-6-phosphate isomerase